MSVPTPIIGRNLQVLADELHLGPVEVRGLQHGEPLTLAVAGDPVTVGIDLKTKTGIRFCSGDEQKWKEQSKREWDKYTFGVYGCWMMDDDGNLDTFPRRNTPRNCGASRRKAANATVQRRRSTSKTLTSGEYGTTSILSRRGAY